jgi:hypothetical protein
MGGDLGISFLGVVDIGFEYFKGSNKSNNDVESTGRLFYAAYNLRASDNCLKFLLGYSHNSIRIKDFYGYITNLNVTGPLLGILFSPKVFENQSICLLPGFAFSLAILSASDESRYNYYSTPGENVSIGFEFNVIPKINKEFYLFFTPSVSKSLSSSEIPVVFGFSAGVLFNVSKL